MVSQEEEKFFAERGFGMKMGFGKNPALLVIDFIKAFTDQSTMLGSNFDAQVEQANRLIDASHRRSIPVLFSTVIYEQADLGDFRNLVNEAQGNKIAAGRH